MSAGRASGPAERTAAGKSGEKAGTGAAPEGRHITQSSVWVAMPEGSPSAGSVVASATHWTLPAVVQIKVKPWGWTTGAATATPMDKANHTNIQRTMERASRRVWRNAMECDYGPASIPEGLTH